MCRWILYRRLDNKNWRLVLWCNNKERNQIVKLVETTLPSKSISQLPASTSVGMFSACFALRLRSAASYGFPHSKEFWLQRHFCVCGMKTWGPSFEEHGRWFPKKERMESARLCCTVQSAHKIWEASAAGTMQKPARALIKTEGLHIVKETATARMPKLEAFPPKVTYAFTHTTSERVNCGGVGRRRLLRNYY